MTDNWQHSTLGEIADAAGGLIQTGPFGSQLHQQDYTLEGVPVVMPKDILEGRVAQQSIARIPEEYAARLRKHRLAAGDIVYGRRGDIGRQALIREREEGWLCGTGCLRVSVGNSLVNPEFLHYFLQLPSVVQWISNQAIGATMRNLNTSILRSVPIEFPPIPQQRRIAGILSAYDNFIENCERRIRVLDEMARALYREWFVLFRYPGHQRTPLVDSAAGQIPKGWTVAPVQGELGTILDGDWIETKDQGGDSFRLLQISNIGVGAFVETGNYRYVSAETFTRLSCTEIVPDDILVARMPTPIGRAWLATPQLWRMITAVDVAIVRTNGARLLPSYLVHAWNDDSNLRRIAGQASGTTRLRITRRELAALLFVIPPVEVQQAFDSKIRAGAELAENLRQGLANLRQTRDLLLPRLLSGQLSVEDVA